MNLSQQLNNELVRLIGFSSTNPKTVRLNGPDSVEIAVDLTAVDSMSCSSREIRLCVPALSGADFDTLKKWAEELCRRVTYLLENIGPLELDPDAGKVMIRSTPPHRQAGTMKFYEILLQSHSGGNFSLRRYQSEVGKPGRDQVDIQTTHEVLQKLIEDLVETIPAV
ncbi:MAG: hypothetical protein IH899_22020 [Planctomycetes bacterium]|nr:hypothetical protein [Planctomycetota bacterium]